MNRSQKILFILFAVFIAIQFFQPARNRDGQVLATDISKLVTIPDTVQALLRNGCYDCHSNNSNYPWYVNIQPMGWLMARHIKHGKAELNFGEFGSYSARRQQSKLKSLADQISDGEMPLSFYKWMHKNARFTKEDEALIIDWANRTKDSIAAKN